MKTTTIPIYKSKALPTMKVVTKMDSIQSPQTQQTIANTTKVTTQTQYQHQKIELLQVQDIVTEVQLAFKKRENDNNLLRNQIHEKSLQNDYLEKQTLDYATQNSKYHANIQYSNDKIIELESKVQSLKECEQLKLTNETRFCSETLKEGSQYINEQIQNILMINEIIAIFKNSLSELTKTNESLQLKTEEAFNYHKKLVATIDDLNSEINGNEVNRHLLELQISKLNEEILNGRDDFEKLSSLRNTIEISTETLRDDISKLQVSHANNLNKLKNYHEELRFLILQSTDMSIELESEHTMISNQNLSIKTEIANLTSQIQRNLDSKVEQDFKLNSFKEEKRLLEQELTLLNDKCCSIQSMIIAENKKSKELQVELEDIETSVEKLEKENEKLFAERNEIMVSIHESRRMEPELIWSQMKLNDDLKSLILKKKEEIIQSKDEILQLEESMSQYEVKNKVNLELSQELDENLSMQSQELLQLQQTVTSMKLINESLTSEINQKQEDILKSRELEQEISEVTEQLNITTLNINELQNTLQENQNVIDLIRCDMTSLKSSSTEQEISESDKALLEESLIDVRHNEEASLNKELSLRKSILDMEKEKMIKNHKLANEKLKMKEDNIKTKAMQCAKEKQYLDEMIKKNEIIRTNATTEKKRASVKDIAIVESDDEMDSLGQMQFSSTTNAARNKMLQLKQKSTSPSKLPKLSNDWFSDDMDLIPHRKINSNK